MVCSLSGTTNAARWQFGQPSGGNGPRNNLPQLRQTSRSPFRWSRASRCASLLSRSASAWSRLRLLRSDHIHSPAKISPSASNPSITACIDCLLKPRVIPILLDFHAKISPAPRSLRSRALFHCSPHKTVRQDRQSGWDIVLFNFRSCSWLAMIEF